VLTLSLLNIFPLLAFLHLVILLTCVKVEFCSLPCLPIEAL
jgi:hypothetical protein